MEEKAHHSRKEEKVENQYLQQTEHEQPAAESQNPVNSAPATLQPAYAAGSGHVSVSYKGGTDYKGRLGKFKPYSANLEMRNGDVVTYLDLTVGQSVRIGIKGASPDENELYNVKLEGWDKDGSAVFTTYVLGKNDEVRKYKTKRLHFGFGDKKILDI